LRLEKNTVGRDFVCGDIHGCFDDLEDELIKIRFDKTSDRLFCVGDLIDRGPRSELATKYMTSDWFFTVMGNHENMFLMANMDVPNRDMHLENHILNGGEWAYEMDSKNAKAMLSAISKLPLVIQVGDVIIVHAALPDIESLKEIERDPVSYMDTILWVRGEYPPLDIPGISKVYVGHSIVGKPKQNGKYINIDTGAFRKHWGKEGKLTLLQF